MKKFYVTTSIAYTNAPPHIGFSQELIQADVIARYHQILGEEVFFLTGTDEHGLKIARAAEKAGKAPEEFTNELSSKFKELRNILNLSNNDFIRTTDKKHETYVKNFLTKLYKKGEIYQGVYKGLYCIGCEEFKNKSDLVGGKCPLHQSKPEKIEEKNYFFKLSKYQKKLIELIEKNHLKVEPVERKNEILGFLRKQKLQDISISREKVEWGVILPWDKKQTIYCWIDALLNYLSGGENCWPADLHLIGRDILKFHAVIWPALLIASGYKPPKKIFAHGFFTLEGKKISKTLGNIVYADDLIKKYQPDVVRYFLLRAIPFGKDGDFSEELLIKRYNSDLANDLGNLIKRTEAMAVKYFDGNIIKLSKAEKDLSNFDITGIWQKVEEDIVNLHFDAALAIIWQLISTTNKYIDKEKPWQNEKNRAKVLANLIGVIREIGQLILPFLPHTSLMIEKRFSGTKINLEKALFLRKK